MPSFSLACVPPEWNVPTETSKGELCMTCFWFKILTNLYIERNMSFLHGFVIVSNVSDDLPKESLLFYHKAFLRIST